MTPRPHEDRVVAFYSHAVPDARGRWLRQMWDWDDLTLEADHQYVQWMFPTDAPSGVNPDAPLVTPASVDAFRATPALRGDLERSFDRMMRFYGFERSATGRQLERAARFDERRRVWLTPGNHNHLRLTRVLISLRLLSLPSLGVALFDALDRASADHPDAVTQTTHRYWSEAGERCRTAVEGSR